MEKLADALARFEAKTRDQRPVESQTPAASDPTPPDRQIRDFFAADVLDWALKSDRHTMEHPMFSLSKTPDRKERHYEHLGRTITVMPSSRGIATIWDKDILLYCVSMLVEALNSGRTDVSRVVRLKAYDLLIATNRSTGGEHYKRLEAALDRLSGTRIKTNISTNGKRVREGFGLIDNWKIIERSLTDGRMIAVEITLNDWLYNAIVAREVLTLNREYFQLDGGLERRIYELARKHCGAQAKWTVGLEVLHKKSGSMGPLKRFREFVKKIAQTGTLPDYTLSYELAKDRAIFINKSHKKTHKIMSLAP